jgi:hypothetical protein
MGLLANLKLRRKLLVAMAPLAVKANPDNNGKFLDASLGIPLVD